MYDGGEEGVWGRGWDGGGGKVVWRRDGGEVETTVGELGRGDDIG